MPSEIFPAAMKMEIQVLHRKFISPSTATPPHLHRLTLSLFDQLVPPVYFSTILYYSAGPASGRASMAKALADELPSFFPLAGRFMNDDFTIGCGDQGVEYVEAQVNSTLFEFLRLGPRIELLDQLLPWEHAPASKSDASPLLGIRVNTFECGGMALGITISHIIADAASLGQFLNAWARRCCVDDDDNAVISLAGSDFHHEIAVIFPARTSPEAMAELPLPPAPKPREKGWVAEKIVTTRFLFQDEIISRIKQSSGTEFRSSKVAVALALLWKAFMSGAAAKYGRSRDSVIAVAMNLRGRLSVPIPDDCFGNLCTSVVVTFPASEIPPDTHDLIVVLTEAIRAMNARVSAAKTVEDVSTILIESRRALTRLSDKEQSGEIDVYRCSSWRGFPLYEVDYGWGKPAWASVATQWGQGVWLMDANDGDGIEVWVSLKEKDMVVFKRDPEISAIPVPVSVVIE